MSELSLMYVAFGAGLLSFFSPCVFPLIPAYTAHLSGGMVSGNKVNVSKRTVLIRSAAFILGFSIIFVLLGASASALGQWIAQWRGLIERLGGLVIIVFGLQMVGLLKIKLLMKEIRWSERVNGLRGSAGSLVMGISFGAGWTPCVGLALSSILLLAASSQTVYSGMLLLFIYAMGLGIPFLLLSLAVSFSLTYIRRMNRFLPVLSQINGWLMVAMGLLLYSGRMQKLSAWLTQFTIL